MTNALIYCTFLEANTIRHHVLKVVDNNIGTIFIDVDYKTINHNADDEVLLTLEHNVDLW